MIKLTKTQEQKIDCLSSLCDHDCMDASCLENKIMNSKDPAKETKKILMALIEEICKKNSQQSRAKIGTKKG